MAAAQDPLTVAEAYRDAVNRQDREAALALYADDAVVTAPPASEGGDVRVRRGRDAIRELFWPTSRPPAPSFRVDIVDARVEGDTATVSVLVHSDANRALGFTEGIPNEGTFVVRDGKIVAFTITQRPEILARVWAAVRPRGAP
jgi:ketosteroid isomerase-like protein